MTSILVTGGTGSFGVAFAQHVLRTDMADRLCLYSRDEVKQFQMRQTLTDDPRCRWFIGDVRDRARLTRAMEGVDTVVHAAALKRVEVGTYNPGEMVKTNVLGAMNVVEAATDAGVSRVVALSTDKACAPANSYGASKAMMESLFLAANNTRGANGPMFSATRYGNVAASRGSVIPIWRERIAARQTVTLTDPDATRFWMTLGEAVSLVDWTITHMQGGDLIVPSLPAYQLSDLLAAMGGRGNATGLIYGEKQHEAMIGEHEVSRFRREGPYWSTRGSGVHLTAPLTSDRAPRLTVDELRERLAHV